MFSHHYSEMSGEPMITLQTNGTCLTFDLYNICADDLNILFLFLLIVTFTFLLYYDVYIFIQTISLKKHQFLLSLL